MAYDDPRDLKDETVLTESSDDELLDLQKEYEIKMKNLMEKRRQQKQQQKQQLRGRDLVDEDDGDVKGLVIQRSRSPSPRRETSNDVEEISRLIQIEKRRKEKEIAGNQLILNSTNQNVSHIPTQTQTQAQAQTQTQTKKDQNTGVLQHPKIGGGGFASNFQFSQGQKKLDPIDKEYSFQSIPKQTTIDFPESSNEKEPHTSIYLRKRYYNSDEIAQLFKDKKVLTIDKFFAKVYPPLFSEPQYPNWILIGIILHKSETKFTNDKKKSRYLKLSIGNFNNLSLDLLLFNDAYTKYWKSRVGDVIAILNPTIKPYRISLTSNNSAERAQNLNPRGFNLALDDSSDCLLEIGTARDFGFCKSIKKDGHRCLTPVNTKKFEYCNFHQELAIRKTGSKRMELSGSITMKSPSRLDGSKKAMYLNRNGNNNNNVGGHMITDYSQYKAPTENLYYSGHSFFKDEYTNPKMLENLGEKRRKLKDKREDHELQKKLNNIKSQASLRSLGLSNSRPKEINKQPIEKIAFNQSIVKQIGFNPATTSSIAIQDGGIYKSPTKRRKELADNLQELYDLSNLNASKKLTASLEDKLDKQKKWKANINNLQLYKSSSQSQTKSRPRSNSIGLEPSPFLDTKDKKEVISGEFSDSDSDSDIEIEFNNETERRNYSNLANKK